jgi:rare lipoprotein A (peptidoglycan hydrolase)
MKAFLTILLVILFATVASHFDDKYKWETKYNEVNLQLQNLKQQNHDLEIIIKALQKKKEPSLVVTPKPKTNAKVVRGMASVYTENGCLGCDKNLIMANGQRLDDDVPTIAVACSYEKTRCFTPFKLGTRVRVENVATGSAVVATVTDTFGGIHGRVADLSKAVATAINCKGLCQVQVFHL